MNIVNLYIACITHSPITTVFPPERNEYINSANIKETVEQRFFVWKLLEYALKQSFNLAIENLHFSVQNGKWGCKECFFSLSHSENIVAVAVSTSPVGMDIETATRIVSPNLSKKILTQNELEAFKSIDKKQQSEYLLKKWCAKESIFKAKNEKVFHPKDIETEKYICQGKSLIDNKQLFYAVATKHPENLQIYTNIIL